MSAPVQREFERLVGKYARVMSAAVRRVCGPHRQALVEDVEQEVRLALWKRLQGGKEIAHPVSYLYKAAMTTALGMLDAQAPERPLDAEMWRFRGQRPEPPRSLLPAEAAQLLDELLQRLPLDQARAIRAYLVGLNHGEVAALYGWTESVARHRIYRGIDALKTIGMQEAARNA